MSSATRPWASRCTVAAASAEGANPPARTPQRGGLGLAVLVDLVEVAEAVEAPAPARPLPHQGVGRGTGDPAEELRAGPRARQATAGRQTRKRACEGRARPL